MPDLRPDGDELFIFPGDAFALATALPAGYASGKTFTASWGGEAITPTVLGDTVTVSITDEHTADEGKTQLTLAEVGGNAVWQLSVLVTRSVGVPSGDLEFTVVLDSVPITITAILADIGSVSPARATDAWLKLYASNPDALIVGAITRDTNGAATSAGVVWPDGTAGVYTATTVSTAFPGAVDAYTITYLGGTTKTVTQPAVTRDPSSGAVTIRPALTVA